MPQILARIMPYIIGTVLLAAGVGGIYAAIRYQGILAERERVFKEEVKSYQASIEKANQIAVGLEDKLAKAQAEADQLKERLDRELQSDPVYTSCRLPVGGLQLLNRALQGPAPR